jgi:hypothetical protein
MDIDAPMVKVQVDEIIFDSNLYKEGRPCVHVRTCDRKQGTSQCDFGDWVGARVLLWRDQQRALHVTMVKAVSQRMHPSAFDPPHSQVPLAAACRMAHASSSVRLSTNL